MLPKIVHKRDGYNMDFFQSGSTNDLKKQLKNKQINCEVGACNKGLKGSHSFVLCTSDFQIAQLEGLP